MARSRTKHPELAGCQPLPLRFKDVPCVNAHDQALSLCARCQGDGHICSGERKTTSKGGKAVFETAKEFAGKYRKQRERGGWKVSSATCPDCKGAGLICMGGARE